MVHAMAREPYMMNTDIKSIPVNLWIMLWRIKAVPCILTKETCANMSERCITTVRMEMERPIAKSMKDMLYSMKAHS